MKKNNSFILVVAMIVSVAFVMSISLVTVHATGANAWDGTTTTQPTSMKVIDGIYYYEISTAEELAYIAKTGGDWLNYNYVLTNDIVLNDEELKYDADGNLTIDGTNLNKWKSINDFKGVFNGQNFKISGLYGGGLFGEISGDICNLTLDNVYVFGESRVGGLCVSSGGKIENCSVYGCVIGTYYVAGICSLQYNEYAPITNCNNYALVIASGNYAGGVLSETHFTACKNCKNYGNIKGCQYVGGIVAYANSSGAYDCFNYGQISGTERVGGIVAFGSAGRSENYGNVVGNNDVGGIAGFARYISASKNSGNISGNNYVGGIGGSSAWYTQISGSSNIGQISGSNYVGGIVGALEADQQYNSDKSCIDNYNGGTVSGSNNVGGIVGYCDYATIKTCYMTSTVIGETNVGAIAGQSQSIWGRGLVESCFYLKTNTINSSIYGFGNTTENIDKAVCAKDDSFFCINSDKTLNKGGHIYSSTVTCDATCDNCGYERTVIHTYDNVKYDSDKHWYECDCGEVKPDSEESHTGGTATCTNKAKCDLCKQSYGDLNANNHTAATSWTNANSQHYHTCTNGCDAKLDMTNCADSNKDHKCDVCSASMGTHEAASGKHTCDYCNQTVTECADSDKDHKCDVCGKMLSSVSGTDNENESSSDKAPETDNDKPQTGCGNVIAGTSVGAIVLISLGAFVVMKKRKI